MSRKSIVLYSGLVIAGVLGAWLIGLFEPPAPSAEISGGQLLLAFLGFFLLVGALIGIVLVFRRTMRSRNKQDMSDWEVVREKGKRAYIQSALLKGILLGLVAMVWPLLSDYWKGDPVSQTLNSLWIYIAIVLMCVLGGFYAARRTWDANERIYKSEHD
jgi:MFS family permease